MIDLLKRFAGYYRAPPRLFALDFSCAVAAGLLELAFPIAVTFFIDRLIPIALMLWVHVPLALIGGSTELPQKIDKHEPSRGMQKCSAQPSSPMSALIDILGK